VPLQTEKNQLGPLFVARLHLHESRPFIPLVSSKKHTQSEDKDRPYFSVKMVRWGRKKDEEFGALEFEEYKPPAADYTPHASECSDNSPPNSDVEVVDEAKPVDPELQGQAQEVMNDNLELMREIVMKIREDEEFARNIYKDCPRLQELLKQHPDLRPLFEDPKFIVISFEKVFRDAGGVLPGDPPVKPRRFERVKQTIAAITSHPLFKVFKYLMLIKKIIFMFSPTKVFGLIQSFLAESRGRGGCGGTFSRGYPGQNCHLRSGR
jgi:hypothetical protein